LFARCAIAAPCAAAGFSLAALLVVYSFRVCSLSAAAPHLSDFLMRHM
jgi:hypothetical protein